MKGDVLGGRSAITPIAKELLGRIQEVLLRRPSLDTHLRRGLLHQRSIFGQVDTIDEGGVNPGFANAVAIPLPMGPASSKSVATPVATPAWP